MKLTTKKYVLYYNYLAKIYGYETTYRIDESVKFWSRRFPIMYSDSLRIIEETTIKLNEELRT